MSTARLFAIVAIIPTFLLQSACPPATAPPSDNPDPESLEATLPIVESPPSDPAPVDDPVITAQRITGYYAGMLIGPQTRSDGVNFDTAWIVAVRFDESGTLTAVSEIFDTGETLSVPGVSVPIHREESGDDFYTTRDLTVVRADQVDGAANIELAYSRHDRDFVDGQPTYPEATGFATLRLTTAGEHVLCELSRDWDGALPDLNSSWTAAGILERNGNPRPLLSGAMTQHLPTDDGGNGASAFRFKFNEVGRLKSLMTTRVCNEELDWNFHDGLTNGNWQLQSHIAEVRYFPDGVYVRVEIVTRSGTYIRNYRAEMRIQPQGDAIRGWFATADSAPGYLDEESDEVEWIADPADPAIGPADWIGTLAGELETNYDAWYDDWTVVEPHEEHFRLTFDDLGRIQSIGGCCGTLPAPCPGETSGYMSAPAGGSIYTFNWAAYGDHWFEYELEHLVRSGGGQATMRRTTTRVRVNWDEGEMPQAMHCEVSQTFRGTQDYGNLIEYSGTWNATGELFRIVPRPTPDP